MIHGLPLLQQALHMYYLHLILWLLPHLPSLLLILQRVQPLELLLLLLLVPMLLEDPRVSLGLHLSAIYESWNALALTQIRLLLALFFETCC